MQYYYNHKIGQIDSFVGIQFLLSFNMIDRALNLGTASQQQSYYFQLIPIALSVLNQENQVPSQDTTFRFAILKAQQKIDESSIPIEAQFEQKNGVLELDILSCRLNFNILSFNRVRKQEFILRLIKNQGSQESDIGDYTVDASAIVVNFKENNKNSQQFTIILSKTYGLKFQVRIEKTKAALDRNTKRLSTENNNKIPSSLTKDQRTTTPKKMNFEEQPSKISATEQKKITVPIPQNRRSPPPRFQREQSVKESEKNDMVSQKSNGSKLPLIQTKYKAVTKKDAPAEVKMIESQRLSMISDSSTEIIKTSEDPEWKEKLILWAFLVVGGIIMYFSMHPNRKV